MREIVSVSSASIAGLSPAEVDVLTSRLPADERDRAARLKIDAQRARFVVGRRLVRHVVGRLAATEPDGVELAIDAAGRPLVSAPVGYFASIAHSGDYVAVAVARCPVGVDVEEITDVPLHPRLAARVCSGVELKRLEKLDADQRRRSFMALWARKEAYGKALGVGLAFPMRSITVGPTGSRVGGAPGSWRVDDLDIAPSYVGAVVASGRKWQLGYELVDARTLAV